MRLPAEAVGQRGTRLHGWAIARRAPSPANTPPANTQPAPERPMTTPPPDADARPTRTTTGAASAGVVVREAREADLPALHAIYAHHVLTGTASFETVPPTLEDMAARRAAVRAQGLPYLVATLDGAVAGYCYAAAYRPRPAYRFTVEDSVYVADGLGGRGVGTALLGALITACAAGPWRQMVAVIGDSANAGSIALHRRHGFAPVGTLHAVGFKFGRWIDSVLMQRPLGPGDSRPPAG